MPANAAVERLEAAQALLAMAAAMPTRVYFRELHRAFPVEHDTPQAMAELARTIDGGNA